MLLNGGVVIFGEVFIVIKQSKSLLRISLAE